MSAFEKLRDPQSEVTKLKTLWLSLSDDARSFWRELFASDTTQADIRHQLAAEVNIDLRFDTQLNRFRAWLKQQDIREAEAQAVEEDKAELLAQGLTGEELRSALLHRMKARALTTGDFQLGLNAVNMDLRSERVAIDQCKLALLKKKSDAYDRAQAAIAEAKTSKGGLTPETIRQIEEQLNLR